MTWQYLHRSLEPVLHRAIGEFPAVVIVGPRQSGKTTLLRQLLGESHAYVSLEPPDVRAAAQEDPRQFLAQWSGPVMLDEIQYAPDLLSYIKEAIDEKRQQKGAFVLTGSQNLLLLQSVSESLAGRTAVLRLLPMSRREMEGRPDRPPVWEGARARAHPTRLNWSELLRGCYPELVTDTSRSFQAWHQSYDQTFLERDVRSLRQIGDLSSFQSFVRALAARNGQLLNLSHVSNDLGITVNTARAWLSVLEATFQVTVLRPYHANVGKRLVKTPKVYFNDTGTLSYLLGLTDGEQAARGPAGGALFETAVLAELTKLGWHRGLVPHLYFWRTSSGSEVDFVVALGDRLVPIEAKLSSTPNSRMADGIREFRRLLGDRSDPGYVVHPGDITLPLGDGVRAIPLSTL